METWTFVVDGYTVTVTLVKKTTIETVGATRTSYKLELAMETDPEIKRVDFFR